MNCIEEIAGALQVRQTDNGTRTGYIRLSRDFQGFQGHFPGNPILPGICFVMLSEEFLRRLTGRQLRLRSLKKTKFFQMVQPETDLFLAGAYTEEKNVITGEILITNGNNKKTAMVKLTMDEVHG